MVNIDSIMRWTPNQKRVRVNTLASGAQALIERLSKQSGTDMEAARQAHSMRFKIRIIQRQTNYKIAK